MKSYTDLKQSKKLAEILPLESADMWWLYITAQGKHIAMMYEEPDPHYLTRMESYGIKNAAIRCWSLAALLGVLPNGIGSFKTVDGEFYCLSNDYMTKNYDNPIDACYELILNLHELKLL